MEIQRLKPMIPGYDVKIFNELYEKTAGLRRKLASGINPRRFGLHEDDILSWFDDKFIFVFNKYYHLGPDVLLGHLINSLQLFKCRILRAAYTVKYSQTIIQIEDYSPLSNYFKEDSLINDRNEKLEDIISHLEYLLSDDAFYLFKLTLNPPPYILVRLNPGKNNNLKNRFSDEVLCQYLNLPCTKKILQYIAGLKTEIEEGIMHTRAQFNNKVVV